MKPTNQKQQVIYYLYNYESITMKFVINDSMFWKFNTRLSEMEKKHGTFTNKKTIKFTNRFGRKSDFKMYSKCVSDEKLKEIYSIYSD